MEGGPYPDDRLSLMLTLCMLFHGSYKVCVYGSLIITNVVLWLIQMTEHNRNTTLCSTFLCTVPLSFSRRTYYANAPWMSLDGYHHVVNVLCYYYFSVQSNPRLPVIIFDLFAPVEQHRKLLRERVKSKGNTVLLAHGKFTEQKGLGCCFRVAW